VANYLIVNNAKKKDSSRIRKKFASQEILEKLMIRKS